jgi:site-specific DNA recombinase
MYVSSDSPKYVCKKCRNKITCADLEAVFHEQLKGYFLSPEEIAKHLAQADEVIKAKEDTLQSLQSERQKLVKEMDKVYRAYVTDQITVDGFGRQYRPLEDRLKEIDDELPRLQAEVDFMKIQLLSKDEILAEARDLYARWPSLEAAEKREIIEQIVEQIVVGKDDLSIKLCYIPSGSEMAGNGQRKKCRRCPFPESS